MSRLATFLFLLSLIGFSCSDTHAQTRPRRVGDSSPEPVPARRPSTPPILQGNNGPAENQPASQTNQPVENLEVGEGDIVRVSTTLITVPVSVTDRDNRYIPNLTKEDFRLWENGVEQKIAYFGSVEMPFTVALVIDTSNSTKFRLEDIQEAAIRFVGQLRAEDRVMVVSFDDAVHVLTEPTNNRRAIYYAIRQANPGGSTRLYDAIDFVMNERLRYISGRKAIVLFTDGVDTSSKRANYEGTLRDAEESDALVYPIQYDTFPDVNARGGGGGISLPSIILNWPFPFPGSRRGGGQGGGTGTSRADYDRADRYLRGIAYKTGARHHLADTLYDVSSAFALIAEELRIQYSLGYYPNTPVQPGERRQIRVRVNRPNLAVRSRDSYVAGSTASNSRNTGQGAPPVLKKSPLVSDKTVDPDH